MAVQAVQPDTTLPSHIPERDVAPGAHASASSLFSLAGTTTLITGGGRGLGQALAKGVVEAGGSVACIDLLPEPSNEEGEWDTIKQLASKIGATASYHICDITNEELMAETFKKVEKMSTSVLRGVIACAGVQQMIPAVDYPMDGFRRIMEINVAGAFITSKTAANFWRERHIKGSLCMIASMSGSIANRGLQCTAYNTSKAACHQMCRSVAQEWGPAYGIRVNTLSPGYIRTAMTDQLLEQKPDLEETWMRGALLNRLGAPEDFVGPAVFLLSDASAWMTGADLRVDGGHFPPPAALPAPASLNQPQPPPPDFLSLGFSTALAPSIPSVTDPSTSLQILADASTASSQPYDLFSSDASFPARPAMSQPSESTDGDRSVPSISYLRPFGVTGIQPGLERIVISLAAPPSFSRAQSPALPPSFPQDAFPFLSDPAALPAFRPNQHNSHVSISSAAALSQEERLFEAGSDLPRPELKAELFDLFFRHLGSHFPFLNRQAVERCDNCKVSTSMDAPMLVLSICALAARFSMSPAITGTDTTRSPGLYGVPFADRAKKMILPLLGFPSTRTVQSLLLLSWSEFGQNNDGSFWSLSGMAMRMAVDLGLQLDIEQPHLDAREQAVNRLTWWACLAHDRMLSLGTGRPVMVKSYEVTTPFPSEEDISLVSGHVSPVPSAFPAYCRFMLLCGDLCDVVNNGKGRWKMAPPTSEHADPAENGAPHRTEGRPLQPLEGAITQAYAALPHPLKWSSPNFRKHHDAGLGPIFLHLHLWYHCILIMLYSPPLMYPQLKAASLSLSDRLSVVTRSCLQVSQIIGVAELVGDSPAYEAAPFTNQTFFVSASAWIRDHHIRTGRSILDNSNTTTPSASFSNFPPSSSGPADLLAQSASDEFHLCRNALLRQEKYWLGAGWLAAVVGRKGATVSRTTIETATKGMRTYVSDGEMPSPPSSLLFRATHSSRKYPNSLQTT
ncbi:hypothetical protein JCM8547_002875 [Rhodosporidiobolus lusitaniae]